MKLKEYRFPFKNWFTIIIQAPNRAKAREKLKQFKKNKKMKALSIKQPWAGLIAHGVKDIENRTWKTNFRGRFFIHASAKWDERSNSNNPKDLFTWEQRIAMSSSPVDHKFIDYGIIVKDEEMPLSAIIGEIDIIDCVINHPSIWAEKTHYNEDDFDVEDPKPIWNWVLANPVLYDKPILNVKGKLSFWEF